MKLNSTEKNIQDKLNTYERFDGDKMAIWQVINDDLDQKKRKKRFFLFFWFGGGSFVAGLALFFFAGNNKALPPINPTSHQQESLQNKPPLSIKRNAEETVTIETTSTAKNPTTPLVQTKTIEDSAFPNRTKKKRSSSNIETPIRSKVVFTTTTTSNENTLLHNTTKIIPNEVIKNGTVIPSDWVDKKQNATTVNLFTSSNIVPLLLPSLVTKTPIKRLEYKTIYCSFEGNSSSKSRWLLSISGGITNHFSNYKGSSEHRDLINQTETNLEGWQLQIEFERQIFRKFWLASGIHFNRSWSRFDYKQKTNTTLALDDVILAYYINTNWSPFFIDTIITYGDTSVTNTMERIVKHHNRFDKIQIPLLLGKRFEKGRLSASVHAGIGLDIWMHRSGKRISNELAIQEFDQKTDNGFSDIGWSLKFQGALGIALTKRMRLLLQPTANLSLSDWSGSGDGITQRPFTYGLNVGWQMKL